jgi:GxxExxY protein
MRPTQMTENKQNPEKFNHITEKVIGCAFTVSNKLGSGFLEKVYENALALEIRKSGLEVKQQHTILVFYDNEVVGEYVCDLLVEDSVNVEQKTVKNLDDIHMAQCLNYLKATGFQICLLINFYKARIEVKRIISSFSADASMNMAPIH